MPASQAVRMATLGGAIALGLDKDVGSLEVGKAADIQAVDFSGLESAPLFDVLSHLAYCTGRQQVYIPHTCFVTLESISIDRKRVCLSHTCSLSTE